MNECKPETALMMNQFKERQNAYRTFLTMAIKFDHIENANHMLEIGTGSSERKLNFYLKLFPCSSHWYQMRVT